MSNENNNINNSKKRLSIISAYDLQNKVIEEPKVIVKDMLHQGLAVLASLPKIR